MCGFFLGAGSTPLHYAACGGNAQCCQVVNSVIKQNIPKFSRYD